MADNDMNENGNSVPMGHNIAIEQAEQRERIASFRRWQVEFEAEVRGGFRQITDSISSLKDSLADRNKPNFQALGVMVTVIVVLGGLVYWPIREATTDLKAAVIETNKSITALTAATVSRSEWNDNISRAAENRQRLEMALGDLRSSMVTRLEWQERNHARNQEIDALREAHLHSETNLQRQVDQLRQDFGSVYGTRDIIQDLKKELDSLRQRVNARPFPP